MRSYKISLLLFGLLYLTTIQAKTYISPDGKKYVASNVFDVCILLESNDYDSTSY